MAWWEGERKAQPTQAGPERRGLTRRGDIRDHAISLARARAGYKRAAAFHLRIA
jgi:hypothetical protein